MLSRGISRGQGEEARAAASLLSTHERERTYFAGSEAEWLGLPEGILRKVFHDNAMRWILGIAPSR